jgi:hypothetical protein
MSVHVVSPSRRMEKVLRTLSPSGSVTVQKTTCAPGDGTIWLLRKVDFFLASSS